LSQAKQDFEGTASDLRDAVSALSYNKWADQMHTIGSRLDDAESSLERLESISPGDPAVRSARDEVDNIRSHMSLLQSENWRHVRPDLGNTSEAIEEHSTAVSETPEEE
jgi:hypothetical protein